MEDVRVYRGKKVTLPVTVTDADGAVVDIDGKTLTFEATDSLTGTPTVTVSVTPTVLDGPNGTALLPFVPADTSGLPDVPLTRLAFEFGVVEAGGTVVVASGILHIMAAS
jgi:hypothetical protein